jgi:transposase
MSDVDTRAKRRNKRWPEALKREIVAASLAPDASVSVVARQYDVNANQVFSWRRRYGEAGQPPPPALSTPELVPVTITPGPYGEGTSPRRRPPRRRSRSKWPATTACVSARASTDAH